MHRWKADVCLPLLGWIGRDSTLSSGGKANEPVPRWWLGLPRLQRSPQTIEGWTETQEQARLNGGPPEWRCFKIKVLRSVSWERGPGADILDPGCSGCTRALRVRTAIRDLRRTPYNSPGDAGPSVTS
jgi:hypothetical protein